MTEVHNTHNSLLLARAGSLGLGNTAELLGAVLLLLALLATRLDVLAESLAGQSELGLNLLGLVDGVVNQGKAGALLATKLGLQSEHDDGLLFALVHLGELVAQVGLGDVGEARVDDVDDHLLAAKHAVRHELAGADGDSGGSLNIMCG